MKSFKISIILLSFFCASLNAELIQSWFEYYPVSSNFNGSAYNGETILVYGDNGIILKSQDGGKSWKQIFIGDTFNIIGIINLNKKFYGLTSNGYLIFSNDNGENWVTTNIGNSMQFFKLLAKDNTLY